MHDTRGGKVAPIVVDNWPVSTKRTIGDVLILEPE